MPAETARPRYEKLPLIALRGICAFPGVLLNFDVERDVSTSALDASVHYDRRVILIAQRDIRKESPRPEDLYKIGTICQVRQVLKVPGGGVKALVEGVARARVHGTTIERGYYLAEVEEIPETAPRKTAKLEAMTRRAVGMFDTYASMSNAVQRESVFPLFGMTDAGAVADHIAQNMFVRHEQKQPVLEAFNPTKRMELVFELLAHELEIQSVEMEIEGDLRARLEGQQREHILRERMHAIQSELGDERESGGDDEISEYRRKIAKLRVPKEITEKLNKEVDRLEKQHFGSSESGLLSTYLDLCIGLPWNKTTTERRDINSAIKTLNDDHFGLEKVKERIIEFLAVKQLKPDHKGTIICLIGPPGVGKTSVAISVAKALNRKLARISLGGVHDEAEIRGHRKTYVGAMPGRIIDAVNRVGTRNPLMLLDEIDKLGSDYRGDPSAALLEALDPEQNYAFRDHYLELPFDLSDTMFITTANSSSTIPRPLLDRMEVIEMSSYTDIEKLEIAKRYLLPKQRKKHGLSAKQLKISDAAALEIISGWTRESGMRQLERSIASVCRKVTAQIAKGETKSVSVTPDSLAELLGSRRYTAEADIGGEIGVVRGLAWTEAGGTTLDVEVNVLPGKGALKLTGNLGETMKESAEAAVSYIRSRAELLGIEPDFHRKKDLHIHFPGGGIEKDGPSAGITMAMAVISALSGAVVRPNVTMTGEITLRGRILRIGGLKEKTMAAMRVGAKTVIIPADNEADLEEIDQTVRGALHFVTAKHIDSVLDVALDFSNIAPRELSAPRPAAPLQRDIKTDFPVLDVHQPMPQPMTPRPEPPRVRQ
jgi:ATP-dependent Lon protease